MSDDSIAPLAAIVYSPTDQVEALMVQVARRLAEQGVRLGGVLQHDVGLAVGDPCGMEMENLATGERFPLSQELGSGSEACRLDTDSLARAAVAIRSAVDNGAELIFINKFGAQEAVGAGLRTEMGVAVMAGVPLLTAVGGRFLSEWQEFTGGASALLKPELQSILDWWADIRQDA